MGYIIDKIRKKESDDGGSNIRWDDISLGLKAEDIYYTDNDDSLVPLSVILENYLDFAKNFDGFAVTTETITPPANKKAKIWIGPVGQAPFSPISTS